MTTAERYETFYNIESLDEESGQYVLEGSELFYSDAIDWVNDHPGKVYRVFRIETTWTKVLDTGHDG